MKSHHNIEITNDECVFLHYTLELMTNAISSEIPYDTRSECADINKIGLQDALDYLGLVVGTRDKAIEDAAGGDIEKVRVFIESLHKKITYKMNT